MPPAFVSGLAADANGLADAGPTGPGATGLHNSVIEVRFSLPQFPGRSAQRLQCGVLSIADHGFIVPDVPPLMNPGSRPPAVFLSSPRVGRVSFVLGWLSRKRLSSAAG